MKTIAVLIISVIIFMFIAIAGALLFFLSMDYNTRFIGGLICTAGCIISVILYILIMFNVVTAIDEYTYPFKN